MSDETTTTTETTAEQPSGGTQGTQTTTSAAQPGKGGDDAVLSEIKALAAELGITPGQLKGRLDASRKWEQRAKENSGAAQQAKTLEERLATLEKANTDAEARAMRAEVAQAKGLTAAQGKYLSGATREEMEAAADELKTAFKPSDTPDLRNRRPTEALRPGTVPDAKPEETDPAKLAAKVPRG